MHGFSNLVCPRFQEEESQRYKQVSIKHALVFNTAAVARSVSEFQLHFSYLEFCTKVAVDDYMYRVASSAVMNGFACL